MLVGTKHTQSWSFRCPFHLQYKVSCQNHIDGNNVLTVANNSNYLFSDMCYVYTNSSKYLEFCVLCVHKQLEIPIFLTVSIGTFIYFALLCYLCLPFRQKYTGSYGLTLDAKMKYTQTTYIIDQDWWIYWTIAHAARLGMLGLQNSNRFSIWFEIQMYMYLYNPVLLMEKILLSSNLSELFFNYDKLNDTKLKQVYTGEKLGLLSW